MPSPIGHMLGGVAAAWLVAGRRAMPAALPRRARLRRAALDALPYALLGAAPDLDLLVGLHSTYTHSVGAAAAVALVVGVWQWRRQPNAIGRTGAAIAGGLAAGAALGSHVLLDWLGHDTTPPIGIMALWPFSADYYQSSLFVFDAISRRYWEAGFYTSNAWAAVREIVILSPICAVVAVLRRRGPADDEPRHERR